MGGVREHINWLDSFHLIGYAQQLQVACLSGRITTYIDNPLWGSAENGVNNIGMHSCTWWVGDNHIRASMLGYKIIIKHILHITSIEKRVFNAVDF